MASAGSLHLAKITALCSKLPWGSLHLAKRTALRLGLQQGSLHLAKSKARLGLPQGSLHLATMFSVPRLACAKPVWGYRRGAYTWQPERRGRWIDQRVMDMPVQELQAA
eukprot:3269853-Heterocapsa_arctica.AAC.1